MTAKLIRGRGIRRILVRSLPLVVLDIAATVVAFLIAAWGTKAGEIDLASPFFMGQMALLSLVNVAHQRARARRIPPVQQPLGVCERGRCGAHCVCDCSGLGNRRRARCSCIRCAHAVPRIHLRLGDFAGDLRHGAFCHTCEF